MRKFKDMTEKDIRIFFESVLQIFNESMGVQETYTELEVKTLMGSAFSLLQCLENGVGEKYTRELVDVMGMIELEKEHNDEKPFSDYFIEMQHED